MATGLWLTAAAMARLPGGRAGRWPAESFGDSSGSAKQVDGDDADIGFGCSHCVTRGFISAFTAPLGAKDVRLDPLGPGTRVRRRVSM